MSENNATDIPDVNPFNGGDENQQKISKYAPMPVERYASHYKMSHSNRGMAIIFNHEHFDNSMLDSRTGTNVDCKKLSIALQNLGFTVTVYKDLKLSEIQQSINEAANTDHNDSDCILVAILSHGGSGYIDAKDTPYKLDSIWSYFTASNCPSLAGKPKLFFIQACQGKQLDGGVTLLTNQTETDFDSTMSYKIPVHADFLIAYSSIPGYYSWRRPITGSWFIQSLCAELELNGKKYDLLTLLTFVCQRVAIAYETNVPGEPILHKKKQIPCSLTTLTRILQFK